MPKGIASQAQDHSYNRLRRHLCDPQYAAEYLEKAMQNVEYFASHAAHEALELAVEALCDTWKLREHNKG